MLRTITNNFAALTVLGVGLAWFFPAGFTWMTDGRITFAGQPLLSLALGTFGGQFGFPSGVSGTSSVGACFQDSDLLIELPPHVLHQSEVLRLCFFEG